MKTKKKMVKKYIGVTIIVTLEQIIGFFLFFGSIMLFLAPVPGPHIGKSALAISLISLACLAGLIFLFLGGTLKRNIKWARIVNILVLPFLSCVIIYTYFMFHFTPNFFRYIEYRDSGYLSPEYLNPIISKMLLFSSFLVIFLIIFNALTIFYLTRPKVKEQFRHGVNT